MSHRNDESQIHAGRGEPTAVGRARPAEEGTLGRRRAVLIGGMRTRGVASWLSRWVQTPAAGRGGASAGLPLANVLSRRRLSDLRIAR